MMEFGTTPDPSAGNQRDSMMPLFDDVFADDKSTGDPEIDAYLDDDKEDDAPGMENIDDHLDLF